MIIECINCSKKFEVDSELIPTEGRTIQCGSCNHLWFFKKNQINQKKSEDFSFQTKEDDKKIDKKDKSESIKSKIKNEEKLEINPVNTSTKNNFEIIKYKSESKLTLGKLLSYILVVIISFIGLIILIDTFKIPLYNYFPNLEHMLFSLFETLKDITLFIKDLF